MKQTMSKEMGIKLKKYREEHFLTQAELADILSVAPSTISKYEIEGISNIDVIREFDEHLNTNFLGLDNQNSGKKFSLSTILKFQNESFIIEDIDGKLLKKKGNKLKEDGYNIKVLNLKDPRYSNCYNPLIYLKNDLDIINLVKVIMLATTPKKYSYGDPFWVTSEETLLQSLIFYLIKNDDIPVKEKCFGNIMKLLHAAKCGEYENSKSALDKVFETFKEANPNNIASKHYQTFKLGATKTTKSIIVSLAIRLAVFNSELAINLTSDDELDFESMTSKKTALFVVTSSKPNDFNFMKDIVFFQANSLIEELDRIDINEFDVRQIITNHNK